MNTTNIAAWNRNSFLDHLFQFATQPVVKPETSWSSPIVATPLWYTGILPTPSAEVCLNVGWNRLEIFNGPVLKTVSLSRGH